MLSLATFTKTKTKTKVNACRDNYFDSRFSKRGVVQQNFKSFSLFTLAVVTMVNWSCSSALCANNFRTKDENGEKIKYYRLPRDPEIQRQYESILHTKGMNFENGHICSEHWSSGERNNTNHLPDIAVPPSQIIFLEKKINNLTKRINSTSKPLPTDTRNLKTYKRKLELANSIKPNKVKRKSPLKRNPNISKDSQKKTISL